MDNGAHKRKDTFENVPEWDGDDDMNNFMGFSSDQTKQKLREKTSNNIMTNENSNSNNNGTRGSVNMGRNSRGKQDSWLDFDGFSADETNYISQIQQLTQIIQEKDQIIDTLTQENTRLKDQISQLRRRSIHKIENLKSQINASENHNNITNLTVNVINQNDNAINHNNQAIFNEIDNAVNEINEAASPLKPLHNTSTSLSQITPISIFDKARFRKHSGSAFMTPSKRRLSDLEGNDLMDAVSTIPTVGAPTVRSDTAPSSFQFESNYDQFSNDDIDYTTNDSHNSIIDNTPIPNNNSQSHSQSHSRQRTLISNMEYHNIPARNTQQSRHKPSRSTKQILRDSGLESALGSDGDGNSQYWSDESRRQTQMSQSSLLISQSSPAMSSNSYQMDIIRDFNSIDQNNETGKRDSVENSRRNSNNNRNKNKNNSNDKIKIKQLEIQIKYIISSKMETILNLNDEINKLRKIILDYGVLWKKYPPKT